MIPEHVVTLIDKQTVARKTIILRFSRPDALRFRAGQFISLKVGEKTWRAYSVASNPSEKEILLVVRLVPNGKGSVFLENLPIGAHVTARGPFGHFVFDENAQNHVFCATGTGIAPFRSMLLALQDQKTSSETKKDEKIRENQTFTLWYGGRDENDLAFLDEMSAWHPNLQIKLGLSQNEAFTKASRENITVVASRITEFTLNEPQKDQTRFYLCGNGAMVKEMQQKLMDAGVPRKEIWQERFN